MGEIISMIKIKTKKKKKTKRKGTRRNSNFAEYFKITMKFLEIINSTILNRITIT